MTMGKLKRKDYDELLLPLQLELTAMARWVQHSGQRLLVLFEGRDTAGKGGIVKHVVGAGNPQGIRYSSFGKPTEEELSHHYLWRIRSALPTAGHIGVFDRSHYEDVLIGRVRELADADEI